MTTMRQRKGEERFEPRYLETLVKKLEIIN